MHVCIHVNSAYIPLVIIEFLYGFEYFTMAVYVVQIFPYTALCKHACVQEIPKTPSYTHAMHIRTVYHMHVVQNIQTVCMYVVKKAQTSKCYYITIG